MLRITVISKPESLTFQLEGKLAGPWVAELEQCRQNALAGRRAPVSRFDLTGVTFIDAAGKQFLAAMHREGADFVTSGCMMRAVVAEIARARTPPLTSDEHDDKPMDAPT